MSSDLFKNFCFIYFQKKTSVGKQTLFLVRLRLVKPIRLRGSLIVFICYFKQDIDFFYYIRQSYASPFFSMATSNFVKSLYPSQL